MSTDKTLEILSGSLEETLRLGERIGRACKGGEIFQLSSDLGGGKTAFVRGLALGLGSDDEVTSPSFTINNTYEGGRYILEHFDFYRLEEIGILENQLKEDIDQKSVIAIEWGQPIEALLAHDRTAHLNIRVADEDKRIFEIIYPLTLSYLFGEAD